jgi:hypothetical protein
MRRALGLLVVGAMLTTLGAGAASTKPVVWNCTWTGTLHIYDTIGEGAVWTGLGAGHGACGRNVGTAGRWTITSMSGSGLGSAVTVVDDSLNVLFTVASPVGSRGISQSFEVFVPTDTAGLNYRFVVRGSPGLLPPGFGHVNGYKTIAGIGDYDTTVTFGWTFVTVY